MIDFLAIDVMAASYVDKITNPGGKTPCGDRFAKAIISIYPMNSAYVFIARYSYRFEQHTASRNPPSPRCEQLQLSDLADFFKSFHSRVSDHMTEAITKSSSTESIDV